MTVRELMEKLRGINPDKKVMIETLDNPNADFGDFIFVEVKKVTEDMEFIYVSSLN